MAIQKQEFYEGAALHRLIRGGQVRSIRIEGPFVWINDRVIVNLKYSTKIRSPWGFTFMPSEQALLSKETTRATLFLGLICGSDGVAAIRYDAYQSIAAARDTAVHIACYRGHAKSYAVAGPDGELSRKISPSAWQRILDEDTPR